MNRSALFVPGDKLELVTRLAQRPSDQQPDRVIVDLEDSIVPRRKTEVRAGVARALDDGTLPSGVLIRINGGNLGIDDLTTVCQAGAPNVLVPKADANVVEQVANVVRGLGCRPQIWALIESARGIQDLDRITAIDGVAQLAIGETDLCAELAVRPGAQHALWPLRMQLVLAAARADLDPPIGPIDTDFADLKTYARETRALRDAGFAGRLAIHPNQVPIIHEVFTPSSEELRAAHRTLELHSLAAASGRGAVTDDDGRMIDEAVVRAARRLIRSATPEETT